MCNRDKLKPYVLEKELQLPLLLGKAVSFVEHLSHTEVDSRCCTEQSFKQLSSKIIEIKNSGITEEKEIKKDKCA